MCLRQKILMATLSSQLSGCDRSRRDVSGAIRSYWGLAGAEVLLAFGNCGVENRGPCSVFHRRRRYLMACLSYL